MLAFIDESGDLGLDVGAGASAVFVLGMVAIADRAEALRMQPLIAEGRQSLGVKGEFKFQKCSNDRRDRFFTLVSGCQFRVRAVVVRKDLVGSRRSLSDIDGLYGFFLQTILSDLSQAHIVIDGSSGWDFLSRLRAYLRRHTTKDAVRSVKLKDSRSEPLLQLADMAVGAIARSYRTERRDAARWRNMLQAKIDDIYEYP